MVERTEMIVWDSVVFSRRQIVTEHIQTVENTRTQGDDLLELAKLQTDDVCHHGELQLMP